MDSQNHRLARFALPALLVLVWAAASAQEPNPYYVGARQELTRESNLFRAADGLPSSSDTVSSTALLAGIDQPIGRQRLFADLALREVRYADSSQLNHTGGGLLAGLDWEAADAFVGRLSYGADRVLARYGADLGFDDPNRRVLQTTEEWILRGQYGLVVAPMSVEASFVRRKLDFSVESGSAFDQDAVAAALKYRPSGGLTLGIGVRRTEGSYPFAGPVGAAVRADDFDRDDVDLTAIWVPTGASTLTARLSRTSEKHQGLAVRDVKANTGAINWNFKPTGKLTFIADWVRDTGAETTFSGGITVPGAPAAVTSPLATTWQLATEYEATARIKALVLLRYLKRDLISSAGTSGGDSMNEIRLGANWTPLRSVLVGCSIGREERNTGSALSYGYSATTTRCLAQFRTQ